MRDLLALSSRTMRRATAFLGRRFIPIVGFLAIQLAGTALAQGPGGGVMRPNVGPGQGPRVPYTEIEWRYWWWLNMEPLIDLRGRLGMDGRNPRIGGLDTQQIVDALSEATRSGDPAMRSAAYLALGKTGAESAEGPLILGLDDSAVLARRSAILGLGVLGRPSALDTLDAIVRSDSWETRERATAAVALGLLEGDSTPPMDAVSLDADTGVALLGGPSGQVARYDLRSGDPLDRLIEAGPAVQSIAREGDQVAIGRADGSILLIEEGKRGKTQALSVSEVPIVGLAFRSGTRQRLAAVSGDRVYLIDPRRARQKAEYRLGLGRGLVAWSTESSTAGLLCAAAGSSVAIIDGERGEERAHIDLGSPVTALIADPSGDWIAATDSGGVERIHSDGTHEPILTEGPSTIGLALVDGATRLAILTEGGALRMVHAVTGTAVATLPGVPGRAAAFVANRDDSLIILTGDRVARYVDASSGSSSSTGPAESLLPGPSPIVALDMSPRHDHVVIGREDGTCTVASTKSGAEILSAGDPATGAVTAVRFDPRGDKVVVARGASLELWRIRDSKLMQTLTGARSTIRSVEFLSKGERVAAGCEDGVILLWSVDSGAELARLSGVGAVTDLRASPANDHLLAATDAGGEPALWDIRDRIRLGYLVGAGGATAIAFSPDGTFLMATTTDGSIHGFEIANDPDRVGELLGVVGELGGPVSDLAWSPDDRNLVAVLADGRVLTLDAETGTILSILEGTPARCVAYQKDGATVAVAGESGAISMMDAREGLTAALLRGRSGATVLASLLDERTFSKLPIPIKGAVGLGAGLSGDPALVEPIRKLLTKRKSEASLVRTYFATGLGGIDDELAIELLIALVKDKDTQVRRAAAMAIGSLLHGSGHTPALKALVRQEDKESELFARSLQGLALARIGGTSATRMLAESLVDKPLSGMPNVVGPPRITFGAFGREPYAALGLGLIGHKNASPLLAQRLERANDISLRAVFSIALGLLQDGRAAPAIENVLRETADPSLRGYLSIALGLVGAKGSIGDVEQFLVESNDIELIPGAAIGLALLSRNRVTSVITDRLRQESNSEAQRALLYALGQVGDGEAAALALSFLTDQTIPTYIRASAAQALGELADPKRHPPLWRLRANFNFTLETEHLMPPGGWMTLR